MGMVVAPAPARFLAPGDEQTTSARRSDSGQLTPAQIRQVQELRARDREVRAHEQAHLAAAGPYARSGARYQYQQGPDHRRYAVGGEVNIDASAVQGDPQATVRKAEVVRRAALAPAQPSPQDRRVAAQASAMESRARQEIARERSDAREPGGGAGRLRLYSPRGSVAAGSLFDSTA